MIDDIIEFVKSINPSFFLGCSLGWILFSTINYVYINFVQVLNILSIVYVLIYFLVHCKENKDKKSK